ALLSARGDRSVLKKSSLVPLVLTITFSGLLLLCTLFIARRAWRARNSGTAEAIEGGATTAAVSANRWLRGSRLTFLVLVAVVFLFHSYWVFWADSSKDSRFVRARAFDARNRRFAESSLKGWVLDRSGKLENALIRYRYDGRSLVREYPLGKAAVHITGFSDFVYGAGGLE